MALGCKLIGIGSIPLSTGITSSFFRKKPEVGLFDATCLFFVEVFSRVYNLGYISNKFLHHQLLLSSSLTFFVVLISIFQTQLYLILA